MGHLADRPNDCLSLCWALGGPKEHDRRQVPSLLWGAHDPVGALDGRERWDRPSVSARRGGTAVFAGTARETLGRRSVGPAVPAVASTGGEFQTLLWAEGRWSFCCGDNGVSCIFL